MKRVLVTGADGFIGRTVCRTLAEKGHHVIAGSRSGSAVEGAQELRRLGDLAQPDKADGWVADVDTIVHLAARVHVMDDRAPDALAAYRSVNVSGTRALAEAAEQAGVERLLFLSTIKVNGEKTADQAFTETDSPAPQDPYGISKWEAEQFLNDMASRGALETVILRIPLAYGPGVKANFLSLLKLCDTIIPIPLGAITDNRRSFIYVGNLADAIANAIVHQEAAGKTFLVSDGSAVSTAELARTIRAALGRPPRLWRVPSGILSLMLSLAGKAAAADRLTGSLDIDTSAISNDLGWKAPWDLKAGIAATVNWHRG